MQQWQSASAACDFVAVAEQNERGDGADAPEAGQLWFGLGVQLREAQARLQFARRLFEDRREAATGPAPGCPAIHQDGKVSAADDQLDVAGVQLDGPALQHQRLALATLRPVA